MNIENIVDVQISVSKSVSAATRFGHMLIICPAPKTPGSASTPDVAAYSVVSGISELEKAGFTEADPAYGAMQVMLKAKTLSDTVYIAVQKDAGEGAENISTTFKRARDFTSDFWAVCPVGISDADLQTLSIEVESAKPNIMMIVASTSVGNQVITGEPERTRVIHETNATDYANVGEAAAILPLAPGSATFMFQTIPGLEPQSLSESEISSMEKINTACYVSMYGHNCTYGGKTCSGEYADVVLFKDWLVDRVQRKVAELFIKNDKVPYTDAGITMVQSCIVSALEEGRLAGGIADNEVDDDGNTVPGYTVSVPRAASLDAAARQSRSLELCTFEARLAGAIHNVKIRGTLTA